MLVHYICQNYCYCIEHESDDGWFDITSLKITYQGGSQYLKVTT